MYSRFGARVDAVTAGLYADPAEVPAAVFLTAEEQARAAREWQTLDAIEAAPEFFGREALAWAATHPTDARLAEALHRVVRATRLGCTTDGSGDVSRRRSRCSTSASRAASGRRRRRTGSADPGSAGGAVEREPDQTAGSFWRVLTMPPIRPIPTITSAPAMIHTDETPMRDAA